MEPIRSLAEAGGLALNRYVAIHNDIFAPSWWRYLRRLIPVPGVFEAIPYGAHRETLSALRHELASLRHRADALRSASDGGAATKQFLDEFASYSVALSHAISKLESICDGMNDKANGQPGPSWAEYQRDLQEYDLARESYARHGKRLNAAYTIAAREV